MSAAQGGYSGTSKKAVHVKWAGKTIALGTFPAAEADEKCARAKALTRAWRSSMRPKPTREWVMVELERLGVRVVSGRLGRKAGEDGDDDKKANAAAAGHPGTMERNNSLGWGTSDLDLMARRNSSLGLSMMNDAGRRGSLGSLGQVVGMEGDPIASHRPMVGNGAAAAYDQQQRRSSSLGLGTLGSGMGNMGMPVNPNQHYEMLKLHHMNLLNEIQETTLMMNLYQQQQLQQQQQQLQQQAGDLSSDPQLSMMLQNQGGVGMDPMFGQMPGSQRASLGLGGSQLGGNFGGQQVPSMIGTGSAPVATDQKVPADATAPTSAMKDDTAKEAKEGEAAADAGEESNKRKADSNDADEPDAKKAKEDDVEPKAEEKEEV